LNGASIAAKYSVIYDDNSPSSHGISASHRVVAGPMFKLNSMSILRIQMAYVLRREININCIHREMFRGIEVTVLHMEDAEAANKVELY
jgi:hypothetical protein